MKISIILGSIRIGRQSIHPANYLIRKLKDKNIDIELLDLAEYKLPVMEERIQYHPNPPAEALKLEEKVVNSDAIIFVCPEYNGVPSPALKNAVDYLNPKDFKSKPIGVVTVSNGIMGGMRAALQLQQLVMALFAYPCPTMLLVPQVQLKFDENSNLIDKEYDTKVDYFINKDSFKGCYSWSL